MAITTAEGIADPMTWNELATHASLTGLTKKSIHEFDIDASLEWGTRVH